MATRSLGTLTLDLIARIGGFEAGLSKAQRLTDKEFKKIQDAARKTGQVVGVALAAGVTGAAALVVSTANSAKEIQNLSALANTSTRDFQRLAYGAREYGVAQDKVSDILKDVNDKVGEFLSTGGGPLIDFFQNIAPIVGVTADNFRGLSGRDALQLYVSTLERANASQAQMTFYLEALASDATALLPLFRNNGRELGIFGDRAERIGLIIDDMRLSDLRGTQQSIQRVQDLLRGISNDLVVTLAPTIEKIARDVADPSFQQGVRNLAGQIIKLTEVVVRNAPALLRIFATFRGAALGYLAGTPFGPVGQFLGALAGGAAGSALPEIGQGLLSIAGGIDTARKAAENITDAEIKKLQDLRTAGSLLQMSGALVGLPNIQIARPGAAPKPANGKGGKAEYGLLDTAALEAATASEEANRKTLASFRESLRSLREVAVDEYNEIERSILAQTQAGSEERAKLLIAAQQQLGDKLLQIQQDQDAQARMDRLSALQLLREEEDRFARDAQEDPLMRLLGIGSVQDLRSMLEPIKTFQLEFADSLRGAFDGALSSASQLTAQMVLFGEGGSDAAKQIGRALLTETVAGFIQAGARAVAFYALQRAGIIGTAAVAQTAAVSTAATQTAANATIAASAAPAAGLTSLASFGANALPALAGIAAVLALTKAVGAFEKGGLVSGGEQLIRINERGQEFVMNADATRRYRGVLEAMNENRYQVPSISTAAPTVASVASSGFGVRVTSDLGFMPEVVPFVRHGELQMRLQYASDGAVSRAVGVVGAQLASRSGEAYSGLQAGSVVQRRARPVKEWG